MPRVINPKKMTWLQAYMEYTKEQEAPDAMHYWSGIAAIAGALGRNIWMDRGYGELFPNFYTILVGPSGLGKSYAIKIAIRRILYPAVASMDYPFIIGKTTKEDLVKTMAEVSRKDEETGKILSPSIAFLFSSEWRVMLGDDAESSGILGHLVELYDCDDRWENRTKTQGRDFLDNVCLNMASASTAKWISVALSTQTLGGGFTERVIFVVRETTNRSSPNPKLTREMKELEEMLIIDLKHISTLKGEVRYFDQAKKLYEEWYKTRTPQVYDPILEGYFSRKRDFVLKTAMVLSASRGDSLMLSKHDIKAAIKLLGMIEMEMPRAFGALGLTPSSKEMNEVHGKLASFKQLSRVDLLKKCYRAGVTGATLTLAMSTLCEAEYAVRLPGDSGVSYRITDEGLEAARTLPGVKVVEPEVVPKLEFILTKEGEDENE